MKRKLILSLLLCLGLIILSQPSVGSSIRPQVLVSIPPQKWLCEQLGGHQLKVQVLIPNGQEPHNFSPSPRLIQSISGSALFFTVGLEFEREIIRRLETGSPGLHIVDSSVEIQKIPLGGTGHGHTGGLDPHVWLSPINLKQMAFVMASALVGEDPGHASGYEKNLQDLNERLDRLDQVIAEKLAPFRGASFFVFHPAFGYFAHEYQLRQVPVEIGGKSPTPKQLYKLIHKAKEENVKVIFVQPQFDSRSAKNIANAIGGEVLPLDTLAEDVAGNLECMASQIEQALRGQEKK